MSGNRSDKKHEIYAVIDTQIFVPAIACREREARFYNTAILTCWKIIFSEHIRNEYVRVIHQFGFRADVIIHELNKVYAMKKYRTSEYDPERVPLHLAPRKDRHIVAPCIERSANLIVTNDSGILAKKKTIQEETGARVVNLDEALHMLEVQGLQRQ